MNVFVDVDYTILGYDATLRPGARELLSRLVDAGHQVHLWSGEGRRWEVVEEHGLAPYLSGVHHKPITRYRDRLDELGVTTEPDFVVDDHVLVVRAFGGFVIAPYYYASAPDDGELELVWELVEAQAAGRPAAHPRYRPPPVEA